MEITEIKKELYKQKPTATLEFIRKNVAFYKTLINNNNEEFVVKFEIPIGDMGDADFFNKMDAKLLIRWIS